MELTRDLEDLWRRKILREDVEFVNPGRGMGPRQAMGAQDVIMFPADDEDEDEEGHEEEEGDAAIMAKADILLAAMNEVIDGPGEADGG